MINHLRPAYEHTMAPILVRTMFTYTLAYLYTLRTVTAQYTAFRTYSTISESKCILLLTGTARYGICIINNLTGHRPHGLLSPTGTLGGTA